MKKETNNLNLANKVFNWQNVLILGGRNSGISLYLGKAGYTGISIIYLFRSEA